ncbi:MAG: acyl-CoA dehydrogenase [Gammaproteobacteria bacterium]|nr:acyl-CoA dehydrogenase [Gammaproteobacteria bacterium]
MYFLSRLAMQRVRKSLPPISATERAALEAGGVWWEAELFQGNPDWGKLEAVVAHSLSDEEQAFIDDPTHELCRLLNDWQITHQLHDLPPEVWDFLKQRRFFGIIIPKEYGGLGFSALAHSEVVMKIASRCGSAAVTVMVPNSLGPAELLLHYGSETQKNYYLPRLARGDEIPCFALTSARAGSDAGSISDYGVVCQGLHRGKQVLGLRVSWQKRYITLAPVATVLGLAFRAYDPDGLLGGEVDLGITCALIPTATEGVRIGERHIPLDMAFLNGPTTGSGVFVPLEWIIGGEANLGCGWPMLMDSLAAGRGISLPALGVGYSKMACFTTGAYTRLRQQFGVPIARFEGVEEVLARMAGLTYMMDAGRRLTLSALDSGEQPAVVSAILKHYLTEGARTVVTAAMDLHGGRGICVGPRNYLALAYQSLPVAITVEGANILTRNLIIFGQGALRCHPHLLAEAEAAQSGDLACFDRHFTAHLIYLLKNSGRSFWSALSFGRGLSRPVAGFEGRYYQHLGRYSAAFSFLSDVALLSLGGELKRRERISARFADALAYLFFASALLKRFAAEGRPESDRVLLQWGCDYCFYQIEQALLSLCQNFPRRGLGLLLQRWVFPLGTWRKPPSDALDHALARLITEDGEARQRLCAGIYQCDQKEDLCGRIEVAFQAQMLAEPIQRRLSQVSPQPFDLEYAEWLEQLLQESLITATEARLLREAERAVQEAIQVDSFKAEELRLCSVPNRAA